MKNVNQEKRRPESRVAGSRVAGVKYVSRSEGSRILDRQARKYLGMSGSEFVQRYRSGDVEDLDRSKVGRVAMLIPLAEQE